VPKGDHGEGLHCGASDKDNSVVKQALDAFRKAVRPCAMNGVSPFPQNGEILAVEIGLRISIRLRGAVSQPLKRNSFLAPRISDFAR
jgi:hypothetical protein